LASREIAAAGSVVWRPVDQTVETAVVHRPRYADWSLPKGKLDRGETPRVAAWREVCEETGARVALGRFLVRTGYRVGADRKVVDYFAGRYLSGSFTPSDEVDEVRWLPPGEARELVSYDHDRAVLDAFTALPAELTTMLLVRHAKAGSRSEWSAADELRPLSRNGEKQVEPIRVLAPVYGVDRAFSAPLVRCVETIRPAAEEVGVAIAEEELLSEKAYEGMAGATERRVLEIVEGGGVPLLSSQGGVIPDLVARLANRSGLPLGRRLAAKKGSVWALFFDGTKMVAADYIEVP
jgi:8-oxo-dGTP pyrophosphatase MutT (NUDIX family)